MGGCTNCGGKMACDHRKGEMLSAVARTLATLYPTRRWGDPDDAARFRAGVSRAEGRSLARALGEALDAATFFRDGAGDEYCHWIWILCVGRRPCLIEARDAPLPDEIRAQLDAGEPIREQYLRVCLSTMARLAAVQQVALHLDAEGGGLVLTEAPRAGVYDPPLLGRMQRLVAHLAASDLLHLDFGEISAPPPGYDPGDYAALYDGEPAVANYLFYPQPPSTRTVTHLS